MAALQVESVSVTGQKGNAKAAACCKPGRGLIKVDGCPIEILEPEFIRKKANETITLIGRRHFHCVDLNVVVKSGKSTLGPSEAYAIRQAIARAIVAFYDKYDKSEIKEIKDEIAKFDRNLL